MPHILVIEDEANVQETIRTFLEEEGYQVSLAGNGRIGIETAKQVQPDLIICDIMMPDMDGLGVIAALRELDGPVATTPFIFLTAKADRPDIRQGMNLGADDYLTKPFTLDELLSAIEVRLKKSVKIAQNFAGELRRVESQLADTLNRDAVTGLPNQFLLRPLFDAARTAAGGEPELAMMILGLDRFQRFVTNHSYTMASHLLTAVAERLQAQLPADARLLRLPGDQFGLIIPGGGPAERGAALLRELAHPFMVGEQEVFLTGSLGIARYPDDGEDIDILIRKATMAMNEAMAAGGDTFRLYEQVRRPVGTGQLGLESSLYRALERNEFELYYQPQVQLSTGRIVGAEALIRWHHADRGMVSPGEFIPLAEQTGQILPMGEWIITTACAQAAHWQQSGMAQLRVSVNLSGRQLDQPDIAEYLSRALKESGLQPWLLEIELTESVVMRDIQKAIATLKLWSTLGVRVAMDDFGTGYSSLGYLKDLPFNTLKIDQCFIRNVSDIPENAAIVAAVIQMAHDLNLTVIAEGVESLDELRFLKEQGCDEIQGYLISRPLPAAQFERVYREQRVSPALTWLTNELMD
jgi:diguanylate cyclase (GGDEF)-like protein